MNKNSKFNATVFFQKLQNTYKLTKVPLDFLEGNASEKDILQFKEKFRNQSVIYAWVNKQTLQCYIGSAHKAHKRPFDHLIVRRLSNKYLQQGMTEFGKEAFLLIILEVVAESHQVTRQQLTDAENFYLRNIPRSLQYNVAWLAFSALGMLTDYAKKELSLSMIGSNNPIFGIKGSLAPGYFKKGPLNHMYGKKHTPESREKISQKAKLRHEKEVLHYKAMPVVLHNLKTNERTKPFDTQTAAASFLGYNTSRIIRKALNNPNLILRNEWRILHLTQDQFLDYVNKNKNI